MEVATRGFRIEGSVVGTKQGESETGDIDVLVRHGNESLRVDVTGTESSISGTVYLNDNPFAVVSGDPIAFQCSGQVAEAGERPTQVLDRLHRARRPDARLGDAHADRKDGALERSSVSGRSAVGRRQIVDDVRGLVDGGVDVLLIMQGKPDRPMSISAASVVYDDLLAAGVLYHSNITEFL